MSAEAALEQIRLGRGTQFDPAVVAALCDAVHAGDAGVDLLPGGPSGDELDAWSPVLPADQRQS
jgi:HD-GYP domain-containing protein (c-di-GMP phosphodiesterase class II)